MTHNSSIPPIHTSIWLEEPEPDNPFAARAAYCRGYDVFGQMVGKARWVEMLVLLFRNDLPSPAALDVLEALAVALANPGPRDPSIHAAMCGGVGGSTAAATLIAALSVGAGRYRGARDVFEAMNAWQRAGDNLAGWPEQVARFDAETVDIWPAPEHPPGFDPHGISTATIVRQLLETLAALGAEAGTSRRLSWLAAHREQVEQVIGLPLDISGVAATAFCDLDFSPAEGEMLFLLFRLPGAAAHALEQGAGGFKQFPFYPIELTDDPAAVTESRAATEPPEAL